MLMADKDVESEAHKPCAQEQDILKTILRAAIVPGMTGCISRQECHEKVGFGMRPPAKIMVLKTCVTWRYRCYGREHEGQNVECCFVVCDVRKARSLQTQ